MMTSEEFSDSSITKMQQELTGYLVAAEKLMSLRQANLPHLQSLVEKIKRQYCDLLQKLECSDSPSASNTKESISRNKAEFDTRYQEYVKPCNSSERLPKSSEDEDRHSAYSLCDSRSV